MSESVPSLSVTIEKRVGKTPLQALTHFVETHPEYDRMPATYAGRLDPMASGKLMLLFGEECKNKERYLGRDKEYEIEVLLGVGSDTGDVLGIVTSQQKTVGRKEVEDALRQEVGSYERAYPAFSSKTVRGKPLFLYALEGTLDMIEIPKHIETIHAITLLDVSEVSTDELKKRVTSLLALAPVSNEPSKALGADFRIREVRASWENVFATPRDYHVLTIRVSCGSGAYMRSLAERIGASLKGKALALSIHRTRIG